MDVGSMSNKRKLQLAAFVAVSILLNYFGKLLAIDLQLPIWLDSFGTALTAYGLGPFCGAVVGLSGNLIYGITHGSAYIYGITSIVIGVLIGYMAKKGKFDTIFGTMTVSVVVTLASIVVSVPLNFIFFEGKTCNLWGDGVIGYLSEQGLPSVPCGIIGQFYVDFLDKVITLLLLFAIIKLRGHFAKNRAMFEDDIENENDKNDKNDSGDSNDSNGKSGKAQKAVGTTAILLASAFAFSMLGNVPVSAEEEDLGGYVRTVYNAENGLPCGEANDIVQTTDGILWIATYAGLYRYNGSEFRWMNEYDSVRNANCLYVDEEGRLWIGTNDNGVSIVINDSISRTIGKEDGLPSDSVKCIAKSADGKYYIGTTDSMAVLSLSEGVKILNEIPQVHFAVAVSADQNGYAAAINSEGQLFLLGNGEILTSMQSPAANEQFTCCTFGESGLLYVGTSGNSIYVYENTRDALVRQRKISCGKLANLQSITFAGENRAYICADNGIGYIDTKGNYTDINSDEFNNSIDNMCVDYQGNLWFTSSRLGLLRLSKSVFTDVYRAYGLNNRVVNSVDEWNGCLYFGTDSGLDIGGMQTFTPVKNELTEMMEGVRIRCIRKDSRGDLWICTYGKGLVKVKPDGTTTTYDSSSGSFGDRSRTVMEMSDGTVVAAGDTGIAFLDDTGIQNTLTYGDNFSNAMILSLLEMDDGALLAGTDGDGIVVIRNGQPVRILTRYDGLTSGVILRMTKCSDGEHVLIVTSNGICCMDSQYNIRGLEHFPYFNNYDVWTSEGGKLFVLSSAGIYVLNEKEVISDVETMSYELLDAKSGMSASLTANSWNYNDGEGHLYVCSDTGVYMLDTSAYTATRRSYRMLVSTVKLDGATYPIVRGDAFHIARGVNKVEIFPEVINYTIDDPYVEYYLEGFDNEPTIIYQSELTAVTYTNLPTGSYKFHLAVLDSDRSTVLEESTYQLIKEKEIYDNHWFMIYMVLVAMIAVAWFTWFIARTQSQKTLALQQKQLELAKKQVQMGNETILAIAKTVDAKDENTSQHSQRVSEYSVMIAKEMGFSDEDCAKLKNTALLHDIGKIGIPDRILNKPARLTDEEYAIMKSHVTRGAAILKDFTLVENVMDGVLYHHERYDGKGYAHGLKGEEIPIFGRIIGVADAFDAMTANRVYRQKLDFDFVVNELERCKGSQFDPKVADIMLKLIREGKIDIEQIYGKPMPKPEEKADEKKTEEAGKTEKPDAAKAEETNADAKSEEAKTDDTKKSDK